VPCAERYTTYDQFAWCYSKGWGEDYHKQARVVLEDHVFPRLTAGARVLDLCCGSGDLAMVLLANGFQVTGIDGSERMLEYARARAPEAEFLLEDARALRFEARFDAVLSTFDSLNHVLAIEELESVFRNVHAALADSGLFVFDLNMLESFETLWHGATADVQNDSVVVTRGSYDPIERTGRADITLFRREGAWERSDVTVLEKCYSQDEVRAALDRAGFYELWVRDACELGMRGDSAVGRTFFFAEK
jgi:SAM-dependent methyltransferase